MGCIRRWRARCVAWEARRRAECDRWETTWTQQCDRWETTWTQRCERWRTETERRCDSWEEDRRSECSSWGIFSFICLAWVVVSTWVCRAWSTVTTTVCEVVGWVSTTVCGLWRWVSTTVCLLWRLVTTFVCRAWLLVTEIACPLWCLLRRLAAPAEMRLPRSECIYGWTAAYRVDEDGRECALRVTVRIRLIPDAGVAAADLAAARTRWESAIEAAWPGGIGLARRDAEGPSCPCETYRVAVDVRFVETGEHHAVRVRSGAGRANMTTWFVTDSGGTAAHEVGHMLGNPDEYADANCPSRTVTGDNSLMQTTAGTVKVRHLADLATWVGNRTCCSYVAREG